MFAVVNQMTGDHDAALGSGGFQIKVAEGVIALQLPDLHLFRILPFSVAVLVFNEQRLLMVPWNLVTIFVDRSSAEIAQLSLIDHASKLFGILHIVLASLPSRRVEELVAHYIDGDRHEIIRKYEVEGVPGGDSRGPLDSHFPFSHGVRELSLPVPCDGLNSMHVILVEVTVTPFEHLVVGHHLFKGSVAVLALEPQDCILTICSAVTCGVGFRDFSTVLLPI
jgi:hypothetical protein